MPHTLAVGADQNQIVSQQKVAVEIGLLAILADVVAPAHRTRFSIEGVEAAGARTDEDQIPRDRGGREDSTAGVELPERLGNLRRSPPRSSGDECHSQPELEDDEPDKPTPTMLNGKVATL